MNLSSKPFAQIDLQDSFFDSLKADYFPDFESWYQKKSNSGDEALVFHSNAGEVIGFLYTKIETGVLDSVSPSLPDAKRLKIGTMKILPHGTRLGERFIKKAIDKALSATVNEIYVTVFPKHEALIKLFQKYGFTHRAMKGGEQVWVKTMSPQYKSITENYPFINLVNQRCYLLSIYPEFHTRLFPDSKLLTESPDIISNVSHSNSIHKIYLAGMSGLEELRRGDILMIYRTSDKKGPAKYRSVATSICVMEEYKNINSFSSEADFLTYCRAYSVFSDFELRKFWAHKRYPNILKFTYNVSLNKRPNREELLNEGIIEQGYAGFQEMNASKIRRLAQLGNINASLIFDTP